MKKTHKKNSERYLQASEHERERLQQKKNSTLAPHNLSRSFAKPTPRHIVLICALVKGARSIQCHNNKICKKKKITQKPTQKQTKNLSPSLFLKPQGQENKHSRVAFCLDECTFIHLLLFLLLFGKIIRYFIAIRNTATASPVPHHQSLKPHLFGDEKKITQSQ